MPQTARFQFIYITDSVNYIIGNLGSFYTLMKDVSKKAQSHFHRPDRCLGRSEVYLEARMVVTAGKSVSLVQ